MDAGIGGDRIGGDLVRALRYLRRPMLSIDRIRGALAAAGPAGDVPGSRRASVAIVLCGGSDSPSVCFVERARRERDPWSGDIAFPGGWAKDGDEGLRRAAMRETREEVGLALTDAHHVGDLEPMPISRFESRFGVIGTSVFYVGRPRPALRPDEGEIAHAFWVPATDLYHPDNRTVVHWSRFGPPLPRPAIAVGDRVIWGLTYRLLVRFSDLAMAGRSPLEADVD